MDVSFVLWSLREVLEHITFEDVARETFVPQSFFSAFPEKLIAFRGLLAEKM